MQYLIGSVIGLSSIFSVLAATPAKVDIYTEHFPPYQIEQKNGSITGLATDIVRLIMWEAELGYQIYMVPWTRAKAFSEKSPYSLLYSIARTEQREENHVWIAPLCQLKIAFYKRADIANEQAWEIWRIKQYVVAVAADQLSENYLKAHGFVADKNILSITNLDRAGELLERGRIDFIFGAESFVDQMAARMGVTEQWDKVLDIPELSKTLYLTANSNAPTEYINRLRAAAERVQMQRKKVDVGCHIDE
ncbi:MULTISPECIES: substrate-binding periplasmic protein [Pseudoalteromonas]|uniref:substrate-binding periplasmic protein n=1 Tax=Pseudoalteromonas TaxID=53246 RepID=UPI000FFEFC8E|nr:MULTISPECIES: transporter substrate-binding domain-containing protein [Pseudoalteromonas]MCG9758064.1 transporter substrate-binding domain-containing protein [Pseudoalteromonas sp. Isolate6]NKC18064.1 transporter substrate-binding domain-containing protein [Pseudoalteromonas galatheae]RXE85421.1 ABC transporter substrate-binding protein [Pseudoalteromonas sp. A757]